MQLISNDASDDSHVMWAGGEDGRRPIGSNQAGHVTRSESARAPACNAVCVRCVRCVRCEGRDHQSRQMKRAPSRDVGAQSSFIGGLNVAIIERDWLQLDAITRYHLAVTASYLITIFCASISRSLRAPFNSLSFG